MKWLFVYFVLLIPAVINAQTKISGKVTDHKNKPLKGVSIVITDSYDGSTTDSLGNFTFVTTEKGNQNIQATMSGYGSYVKNIKLDGAAINLGISLKELITELNAIVITAGSFEASDKKKGTVLTSLDIVTTASANADVTGALKTLPGSQQIGESEGLFVRGGTASETKIFIDGNLVNNFFYSSLPGIATRGRFNPFLFKGTVFSSGGYSALYGQALSSALILESVDLPEKTEASLSVSVIGVSGGIQTLAKNKKSSWGLSYGYTNLTPAFAVIKQKQDFFINPEYHELDANFRIKTKGGGMIKYYGYLSWNKTGFKASDIDSSKLNNAFVLQNLNTYQNISWRENFKGGWKSIVGFSFSTNKDNISNDLENAQGEKLPTNISDPYSYKNFDLENTAYYVQTRWVLEKRIKGINAIRFGAEHFYSNENSDYTLFTGDKINRKFAHNIAAAFAETDIYLSQNMAAKLGVRTEHSSMLKEWNIGPRVSLAYKFKDKSQASLAYGIFYQNPETKNITAIVPELGYSAASHYIAQYERVYGERRIRAEVFYKKYSALYKTSSSTGSNIIENNNGKGYAQGLELFWRDKKTFKFMDYWFSYSYLDTKRNYMDFPNEMRPNFAATHTASLVVKTFLLSIKTGFNATYSYASGRPYYQLKYDNAQQNTVVGDNGKTKDYNSLGFSLNYLPNLGKKDKKAFIVWVLSVTNVLGQNQVYGYNYATLSNRKEAITPPSKRFVYIGCFLSFGVDRTQDAINNNL